LPAQRGNTHARFGKVAAREGRVAIQGSSSNLSSIQEMRKNTMNEKKTYTKPQLQKLGLLRDLTKFSF
jgi:hypothetical protein